MLVHVDPRASRRACCQGRSFLEILEAERLLDFLIRLHCLQLTRVELRAVDVVTHGEAGLLVAGIVRFPFDSMVAPVLKLVLVRNDLLLNTLSLQIRRGRWQLTTSTLAAHNASLLHHTNAPLDLLTARVLTLSQSQSRRHTLRALPIHQLALTRTLAQIVEIV